MEYTAFPLEHAIFTSLCPAVDNGLFYVMKVVILEEIKHMIR